MGQKDSKLKSKKQDHNASPSPQSSIPDPTKRLPWGYLCNICTGPISGLRYACSECPHYDLCPKCFDEHGHEHLMYREEMHPQVIFDQLYQNKTTGQALLLMFKLYAKRLAFGYRETLPPEQDELRQSLEQKIEQETSEQKISVNLKASTGSKKLRPLNPYKWITFEQLGQRVTDLGNGLRRLVEPRSFVGICSHIQLNWYIADYACQIHSIIGPTIAPMLSLEALVHIINSTQMCLIFCAKTVTPRFLEAAEKCPSLKYIIQLEDIDEYQIRPKVKQATDKLRNKATTLQQQQKTAPKSKKTTQSTENEDGITEAESEIGSVAIEPNNIDTSNAPEQTVFLTDEDIEQWKTEISSAGNPVILSFSDLEKLGAIMESKEPVITPDTELETIVYTSGSTDIPKGAMFTANAWKEQLCFQYAHSDIGISVTWSISDRKNDYRHLYFGGRIAIYNGDMARIFEDIQEVRPNQVNATPSFWNKIYAEFKASLAEETEGFEPGTEEYRALKEKVLADYKFILGDRVEKIVTGGAPTSPEVLKFLNECFACRVRESYGSTECGGIVSGGFFAPGLDWKLVNWEEYTVDDKPYPRGELCVKRKDMMTGYFGDEETTKEALDEGGYYHTGDIVELNASHDGATIIDRKKNIFKLSQGEYVAPAKIEKALLGASPYIKQVFVYGDSLKSSLVAVIVPHKDRLIEYLIQSQTKTDASSSDAKTLTSSFAEMCKNPKSIELLLSECARVGRQFNMRSFEIPAALILTPEEFTKENGLHTQSEKPARHALLRHFKTEIEQLYADLDGKHSETKAAIYKLLGKGMLGTTTTVEIPENADEEQNQLTFVQMGGDSLTAIKLRNMIKQNFDVTLPVDVLLNPNTNLAKIATYIDVSKRAPSSTLTADQFAAPQVDLKTVMRDARLHSSIVPISNDGKAMKDITSDFSKIKAVFLTGCTGFLGTSLLAELLKSTNATIYCLVRPRNHATKKSGREEGLDPTSAKPKSLLSILESRIYASGILSENPLKLMKKTFDKRVVVVEGDLEKPRFGVDEETWTMLAQKVQIIYNAGAYVNSVLPYHRLAPSNVEGTRTCIELAREVRDKVLVHISTIGVVQAQKDRSEVALESRLWNISNELLRLGGYNLSKYIAELLVWEAIERNFSCIIVRPGFIGPSSFSGYANDNDFDTRLLVGLTQLGKAPNSSSPLITLPVDFLCRLLLTLPQFEENYGQVFHAVNNSSEFSLQVLVAALKTKGYQINLIPYLEWQKLIQNMDDETNPIYTMVEEYFSRPYFHARVAGTPVERTLNFLKSKTKLKVPPTGEDYVAKWIDWLIENKILQPPNPSQNQGVEIASSSSTKPPKHKKKQQ